MSSSLESSQKGRNGHVAKNGPGGSTDAEEKPQAAVTAHSNASCFSSDVVKSMLFGGLDGIITTFAIIAAGEGGGYSTQLILLMGFSKILADATSMGVGDFISERAELEYHRSEMAREIHEITHKPDAERQEMVDIYMQKGMSAEHAERVVELLMRNNQLLDVMMVDELGIFPPAHDENPLKNGFITFFSFLAFGSLPLWLYCAFLAANFRKHDVMFGIAILITLLTLFSLGALNAILTKQPVFINGVKIMINGALATATSYFVALGLETAFQVNQS